MDFFTLFLQCIGFLTLLFVFTVIFLVASGKVGFKVVRVDEDDKPVKSDDNPS